jgi:hypothetical protein
MTNNATLQPSAVYFHPWAYDDEGDQTYCDDPAAAHGWCVYTRHDGEENAPFDLSDEQDFPTREAAEAEAMARAARLGVEAREY